MMGPPPPLPPGWDASPSQGFPQQYVASVPIYIPGWRETIGNLSTDVLEPQTVTGNWSFPLLEGFHTIVFVMSSHSHQQELFLSMERSKTMPKKETFDFQLPSVAHEHLCLSSLMWSKAFFSSAMIIRDQPSPEPATLQSSNPLIVQCINYCTTLPTHTI